MSADNYIYVRKRRDGKYGVSHRSASGYYEDEGWTVEKLQADRPEYVVDESWVIPYRAEKDIEVHDDAAQAILAAHRMYEREAIVEYGVQIAPDVLGEASNTTESLFTRMVRGEATVDEYVDDVKQRVARALEAREATRRHRHGKLISFPRRWFR